MTTGVYTLYYPGKPAYELVVYTPDGGSNGIKHGSFWLYKISTFKPPRLVSSYTELTDVYKDTIEDIFWESVSVHGNVEPEKNMFKTVYQLYSKGSMIWCRYH